MFKLLPVINSLDYAMNFKLTSPDSSVYYPSIPIFGKSNNTHYDITTDIRHQKDPLLGSFKQNEVNQLFDNAEKLGFSVVKNNYKNKDQLVVSKKNLLKLASTLGYHVYEKPNNNENEDPDEVKDENVLEMQIEKLPEDEDDNYNHDFFLDGIRNKNLPWSWSLQPRKDTRPNQLYATMPHIKDHEIKKLNHIWKDFIKKLPPPPIFIGRGIVFTVFPKTVSETKRSINFLRLHGCNLPIEIFQFGGKLSLYHVEQLEQIKDVKVIDLATLSTLDNDKFSFEKDELQGGALI
jgi:hypothetical protein